MARDFEDDAKEEVTRDAPVATPAIENNQLRVAARLLSKISPETGGFQNLRNTECARPFYSKRVLRAVVLPPRGCRTVLALLLVGTCSSSPDSKDHWSLPGRYTLPVRSVYRGTGVLGAATAAFAFNARTSAKFARLLYDDRRGAQHDFNSCLKMIGQVGQSS